MMQFGNKAKMHLEDNPEEILEEIQMTVLNQQSEFNRIWEDILQELKEAKDISCNRKRTERRNNRFCITTIMKKK